MYTKINAFLHVLEIHVHILPIIGGIDWLFNSQGEGDAGLPRRAWRRGEVGRLELLGESGGVTTE